MQVNKPMGDPVCPERPDAVQPSHLAPRTLPDRPADLEPAVAPEETRRVSGLDPRRVDEIRSRILAGAYQTNEMAEQVARAILRSGDL